MNIVLCGMMGAGKTSVGKELQALSGWQCVDTDKMIEEKHGKISDIFEKYGEKYFRDLETETAKELAGKRDLIVATGGGFVMREQNVTELKKSGMIFYLRASISTLLNRVAGDTSRPLLKDGAEKKLTELMAIRGPVYERIADRIIETDGRTLRDIAREILSDTPMPL